MFENLYNFQTEQSGREHRARDSAWKSHRTERYMKIHGQVAGSGEISQPNVN